jgi:hypothetical protein
MQAKEARKKAIDDMDPKLKEALQNIRFYKFYPIKTPDTPDVSKVQVCSCLVLLIGWTIVFWKLMNGPVNLTVLILDSAGEVHQQILPPST